MENTEISARVTQVIEYLKITKSDFAKKLNYSRAQSIYDIINGKSAPSYDFFNRLFNTEYSALIDATWLITGKGEMLKENLPLAKQTAQHNEGIPLIPISAMAGIASGEVSIMELDCQRYVIPLFTDADYLIPVKGQSMCPTYNSGDIVACKKLPITDMFFQWNKVYVVDTRQGALVKRVKKGRSSEHILLISDNTHYDPFEVHLSQIYALAAVVGVVRLE
ncbi:MAG: helix-turn-helix transcriptional regulator [Marinilabiliaceae bacterium]|nr:helix-turn-helix transcriptional regulator [Marinilabiliaceae bacterium]